MRFSLPLAAVVLVVSTGCNNIVQYEADGGRARINCATSTLSVPVTILDRFGDPSPQAIVSLDYLSYGESENLIADDFGKALVKEKYGPGVIRVQGNVNDLRTQVGELTFAGGDCSSSVSPRSLTLQLQ